MDKLLALLKKAGLTDEQIAKYKSDFEELMASSDQDVIDAAVAEATRGLKEKNKELLKKVKENSPEDVQRLSETNETLTAENTSLKNKLATTTKERDKAVARGETSERELSGLHIDRELSTQLSANKVAPELLEGAKALLVPKAAYKVEGDKRSVMIGDKVAADAVKEWAASDAGKAYVAASLNKGSNAPGNTPANGNGGKQLTRTAFQQLSPVERTAFAKEGGTLTDG